MPGDNKDKIEPEIAALKAPIAREPKIRCTVNPPPRLRRHSSMTILDRRAMLNFDKREAPAPLGDEIDFANVRFKAPR